MAILNISFSKLCFAPYSPLLSKEINIFRVSFFSRIISAPNGPKSNADKTAASNAVIIAGKIDVYHVSRYTPT